MNIIELIALIFRLACLAGIGVALLVLIYELVEAMLS